MRLCRLCVLGCLAEQSAVDQGAEDAADDRGNPEHPELAEGPSAGEDGGTSAAGGVDRGVGDRDFYEMDQREAEADGDGREAFGGANVCCSHDDDEEERGEDDLRGDAGGQRVVVG